MFLKFRGRKVTYGHQLVERSLPIPEVRSSNPYIGELVFGTFIYCHLYYIVKTKIKRIKRPGIAHLKKEILRG